MKKRMVKATSFLLALMIVFGVVSAAPTAVSAEDDAGEVIECGRTGDCVWSLTNKGVLTISGNGQIYDYWGDDVPWGYSAKSLIVEEGVTTIWGLSFMNCTRLSKISIADSVTYVGAFAFYNTAWFNSHPDGMAYTGKVAYAYKGTMPENTSISLKKGIVCISDYVFCNCPGLTSITIPDTVKKIGHNAFSGCTGLKSITIPEGVTKIESETFSGCTGLTEISIPDSVTEINPTAFDNCSDSLVFRCNPGTFAESYARSHLIKTYYPLFNYTVLENDTVKITGYSDTYSRNHIVIPEKYNGKPISSLGKWLFANNTMIESVSIPDSIKTIGKGAFYNCTELKTVSMSNKVTEICENAFEKCIYLERINLGTKLKTIGNNAFFDCRSLQTLNMPQTVTSIGEEAFTNCRSLQSFVIPNKVKQLGKPDGAGLGIFENCKSLTKIIIPATVKSIQGNAFEGCEKITILSSENSYAQRYAAEKQLPFKAISLESTGDVNHDSKIDIGDATAIQRFLAEFETLSDDYPVTADVNGDGIVNISDATHLQKYLAEFEGIVLGA